MAIAVIEITGLAGLLVLLAPLAVLLVVILRASRPPLPRPPEPTPREAAPPPTPERTEAAEATLAGLHLKRARDEIAQGRAEAGADHLRSCIRAAAEARDAAAEAEARLELAELARAAGDLTTACEHWQIARGLFHDLARKPELARTERLMQQHGCPTDWVLNDF